MERFSNNPAFLELISCPAYFVKNGLVENANSSAQSLLIVPGTPADSLVETGKEEYSHMKAGCCLSVVIRAADKRFCAFVSREEDVDLFLLDQEEEDPTQLAMFLASCSFRSPLDRILSSANAIRHMGEGLDPKILPYLNELTKGAYQIHRLVANMSDMIPYAQDKRHFQIMDVASTLRETVEKAATLLEKKSIQLEFVSSVPELIMMVNQEKLERAVHNLILNAATYPSQTQQPRIVVELKQTGKRVYITVSDNGKGISDEIFSSLFYRYRRKPTLENSRYGIGLGLPLVRAAAAFHGGSVLVERMEPSGTRVTMTLEILPLDMDLLRAPRFSFDYAGEFDHALLELSDVLPAECYEML